MAKSCLLAYERLQVTKDVVESQIQWPEGKFHVGWHFDNVKEGAPSLHQSLPHVCRGQAQ